MIELRILRYLVYKYCRKNINNNYLYAAMYKSIDRDYIDILVKSYTKVFLTLLIRLKIHLYGTPHELLIWEFPIVFEERLIDRSHD